MAFASILRFQEWGIKLLTKNIKLHEYGDNVACKDWVFRLLTINKSLMSRLIKCDKERETHIPT